MFTTPQPRKLLYTSAELVAHEGPFVAPDFGDDDDVVDFEEYMRSVVDERIANDPTGHELQAHIVCLGEDVVRWRERYDADDYYDEERASAALAEFLKYAKRVTGPAGSPRVRHYLDMASKFEDMANKLKAKAEPNGSPTVETAPILVEPITADDARPTVDQWPVMRREAYYGLPGRIVEVLEPHTEADPVALLMTTLTLGGNLAGKLLYRQAGGDRHYTNLYTCSVGATSKGRKGSSKNMVAEVMMTVDPNWRFCQHGGIGSGEGVLRAVRDSYTKIDKKGDTITIPGATDKRLAIVETEFAGLLSVLTRQGGTAGEILKKGWDGDPLELMVTDETRRATGHHISMLSHVTMDELRLKLAPAEQANGFANRIIFNLVRRSKLLSRGGNIQQRHYDDLGRAFKSALDKLYDGSERGLAVEWGREAGDMWDADYARLSSDRPGLVGLVTARAEAQVLRLCVAEALFDGSVSIEVPHLLAARAIWDHAEQSCRVIFGNRTGVPLADTVLAHLRDVRPMRRTKRDLFDDLGGHVSAMKLDEALSMLRDLGLVHSQKSEAKAKGGRPSILWWAA